MPIAIATHMADPAHQPRRRLGAAQEPGEVTGHDETHGRRIEGLEAAAQAQPLNASLWRSLEELAMATSRHDIALEACVGRFEILSRTGNIYFAPASARPVVAMGHTGGEESAPVELDPAIEDQLRSLGYAE